MPKPAKGAIYYVNIYDKSGKLLVKNFKISSTQITAITLPKGSVASQVTWTLKTTAGKILSTTSSKLSLLPRLVLPKPAAKPTPPAKPSPTPTLAPTPTPTASPQPTPSVTPSVTPSATPTPTPSAAESAPPPPSGGGGGGITPPPVNITITGPATIVTATGFTQHSNYSAHGGAAPYRYSLIHHVPAGLHIAQPASATSAKLITKGTLKLHFGNAVATPPDTYTVNIDPTTGVLTIDSSTATSQTVDVVATDANGNVKSQTVAIVYDLSAPVIDTTTATITMPDTATVDVPFTVTLHATDDTGITSITLIACPTLDTCSQLAALGSATLVNGTAQDGYWQGSLTIPGAFSAGNYHVIATAFDGVSRSDQNAPMGPLVLSNAVVVSYSGPIIDTSTASITLPTSVVAGDPFVVKFHATSASGPRPAGGGAVECSVSSPDGRMLNIFATDALGTVSLESGTVNDGIWRCNIPAWSIYAPPGNYKVQGYFVDVTNTGTGWIDLGTFPVTNTGVIDNLVPAIDTATATVAGGTSIPDGSTFTFTVHATDMFYMSAGVTDTRAPANSPYYPSPNFRCCTVSMTLISGDNWSGVWQGTVTINALTPPGTYYLYASGANSVAVTTPYVSELAILTITP